MSNIGLERHLKTLGLSLCRSSVGDRYVIEKMRDGGFNVGGEQSGHIILSDFATTGDGIVAALQVLAVIAEEGVCASDATNLFEPTPQILENVRFKKDRSPLSDEKVLSCIEAGQARFNGNGRLLVRKSGTEPVIRVMGEGDDEKLLREVVNEVVAVIREAAA
jgi:phosphoglucosamine mutase